MSTQPLPTSDEVSSDAPSPIESIKHEADELLTEIAQLKTDAHAAYVQTTTQADAQTAEAIRRELPS